MFRQLLHKDHIVLGLTGETKEELFSTLLDCMGEIRDKERKQVLDSLLLRESYGTTAIGDNIALPSAVIGADHEASVVLGISRKGVDFSSLDGERVTVIALILIPAHLTDKKKEILLSAQRHFADRFYRERLQNADNSEEVMELLRSSELSYNFSESVTV